MIPPRLNLWDRFRQKFGKFPILMRNGELVEYKTDREEMLQHGKAEINRNHRLDKWPVASFVSVPMQTIFDMGFVEVMERTPPDQSIQMKQMRSKTGAAVDLGKERKEKEILDDNLSNTNAKKNEETAGIEPKKKDKKPLVQIPEEERVPADTDTIELDYYNADIHVKSAEKNIWQIEPFCQDGLALMWGGIRSNFGVKLPFKKTDKDKAHRLAFQIEIAPIDATYQSMQHLPTEFMNDRGDVRIGFSVASTPLILGEHSGSWCITASGKKASNNNFFNFGKTFDVGECVTCVLDLLEGSITYYINGENVGTPFEKIPVKQGDVIYPTICVKNSNVNVNLGQELSDEKWKIPEDRDWMFITEMESAHLKRSLVAPAAKKDCTVLMTVGLPGVGKTTWVNRYLSEHPDEDWTVISADSVMGSMKVNGVSRIQLVDPSDSTLLHGVVGLATSCMCMLAPRRRKNYIIDMTNCFENSRNQKLEALEGFNRKCKIFVPDEDEHQRRLEEQEGEKLDTDSFMHYKAGMSIPILAKGEPLEDVHFVEPGAGSEQLAFDRVAKMNKDAKVHFQNQGSSTAKNRVPPPNFSTPPPQLMPPTQPPMMMYHPQMPPPTGQQYIYPPQFPPR